MEREWLAFVFLCAHLLPQGFNFRRTKIKDARTTMYWSTSIFHEYKLRPLTTQTKTTGYARGLTLIAKRYGTPPSRKGADFQKRLVQERLAMPPSNQESTMNLLGFKFLRVRVIGGSPMRSAAAARTHTVPVLRVNRILLRKPYPTPKIREVYALICRRNIHIPRIWTGLRSKNHLGNSHQK